MKEIKRDIIIYSVLLVTALVIYFRIIPDQVYLSSAAAAESFSPDTFPRFAAVIFFLAALGGLLNSLWAYIEEKKKRGKTEIKRKTMATGREFLAEFIPYIVFIMVLIYGVMFSIVGFIPATIIVPPFILALVGCRKWQFYGIYYIFVAVLYILFKYVLLVPIH